MTRLEQTQTPQEKRHIVNTERVKEIERIKKVFKWIDESDDRVADECEDYREPLCIMTKIIKQIQLSWGGGEDGFKLYFDDDKNLLGGVYYMADWGEYQESELTFDEAEEVFNFYMYGEVGE